MSPAKVDLARSPVPASSYCWLHLLWVFPLKKRHCSGVGLHILRASGSQVLTTQSHLDIFISVGQTPNLFKIIIINLSFAVRNMQIYAKFSFSLCFCILSSLWPLCVPWAQWFHTFFLLPAHPDGLSCASTVDPPLTTFSAEYLPFRSEAHWCKGTHNTWHNPVCLGDKSKPQQP